ncbi:FlgB family protein [Mesobacterium sp. TK19101]|uniref:FlgB family protein n=1 Tax=Mesobacterium hydrothermale TaxID=3111907 RepID=A0ABU6HGP5_9RHOB|nr:FlgB family protein [Mesobacterium sp. TK19101]MEC3861628.1 FlgB family protein [Mesobacterium sp. TK19101]
MFQTLSLFKTAQSMAQHAGQRQALIAQNMANADTPGYVARDLPDFATLVSRRARETFGLRATRPGHLGGAGGETLVEARARRGPADPNGNNVSLEEEMLHSVEARRQHDRALAIYRSGLNILRSSIGRS